MVFWGNLDFIYSWENYAWFWDLELEICSCEDLLGFMMMEYMSGCIIESFFYLVRKYFIYIQASLIWCRIYV